MPEKNENDDFNEIFNRIRLCLNAKSETEVGSMLGIQQSSISGARRRGVIPPGWIIDIAKNYGISSDWLYFGIGAMRRTDNPEQFIKYNSARALDFEDFVYVPVAGSRLAAGNGAPVLDYEEPQDIISFRRPWAKKVSTSPSNLVAFFVEGDSMISTFHDGDLVLIDKGRTQLFTGAFFAVCTGGDLLQIKRLEISGDKVRVMADNPIYPTVELEPEKVMVIGQVIWYCRELVRRK